MLKKSEFHGESYSGEFNAASAKESRAFAINIRFLPYFDTIVPSKFETFNQ